MAATDKLHRWLDLIASLLSRRFPVSLADLRRDVPGYADDSVKEESILRMFERDKDELRELGVIIDTVKDEEGGARYQLRQADFYLPLLSVTQTIMPGDMELRQQPQRTRSGAGSPGALVLTPDECHTLRRAAARVSTLGHPELAADAAQALRKLQFDLEDFATALPAAAVLRVDGEVFDVLTDAVALRKRLTFTYHSMERDETAPREVEPYGLVFLTGHWYLIAHDVGVNGMRQFRVSRIRGAKMGAKPQHPDFEVPPTFDLGAYAASRRAWELGNGDQQEVLVAFRGETGLVSQGTQLGEAVEPDALAPFAEVARRHDIRRFGVRRRESFLRWLLSFGGDAWPIAPADTVAEWRDLLVAARRAHANVAVEVA